MFELTVKETMDNDNPALEITIFTTTEPYAVYYYSTWAVDTGFYARRRNTTNEMEYTFSPNPDDIVHWMIQDASVKYFNENLHPTLKPLSESVFKNATLRQLPFTVH